MFYFAIGHHATPVFHRLLGRRAGDSGARSFRLLMAISVVIGAVSVQWYSILDNPRPAIAIPGSVETAKGKFTRWGLTYSDIGIYLGHVASSYDF